jgi:hypothetical protein
VSLLTSVHSETEGIVFAVWLLGTHCMILWAPYLYGSA